MNRTRSKPLRGMLSRQRCSPAQPGHNGPGLKRSSPAREKPSKPEPQPAIVTARIALADSSNPAAEDLELTLLLEAVFLQAGFDFRNYNRAVLARRVLQCVRDAGVQAISELQALVLRDALALERLLLALVSRESLPFCDAGFYRAFRRDVVPWLRTFPYGRLWLMGCAGGAEVYSLAIILMEEGLQDRCRIYATDVCESAVHRAQGASWFRESIRRSESAYRKTGGRAVLADYFIFENGHARVADVVGKNITFAAHNPVTDASFNEFQVIVCREVMGDFDPILQAQVHDLIYESLMPRGLLVLGRSHSLSATLHKQNYEPFQLRQGIYQKKRPL